MIKKIKLARKITIKDENGMILLYERVSINTIIVLSFIVAILYNAQRIEFSITILLVVLILSSILFKRCNTLDVKNGIVERKLMIAEIDLLTYFNRSVGSNYEVFYEYHKLGANGGFIILYYLILKDKNSKSEIKFIKFRSENEAIELKKLIENYGKE